MIVYQLYFAPITQRSQCQSNTWIRCYEKAAKLQWLKSVVRQQAKQTNYVLYFKIQIIKVKHLQNETGEVQAGGAGRIAN